jgi:regulator of sirC expression with transglutaminase-like and TPR domain
MTFPDDAARRLASLLEQDDFDLAEAALLLAAREYPDLVVRRYLARLDDLADEARPWVDSAAHDGRWWDGLSRFLFAVQGFRGDPERYDDPRNSYLNQVLERRVGLPILLSLVYVEVARRCAREAEGVGLPGHFVVRARDAGGSELLDPFNGGVRLTEAECRTRVQAQYGEDFQLRPEHLQAASKREILARMLRNLKASYLRRGDADRALRAVDDLLLVTPDAWQERRDRGLLRMRAGRLRGALADLDAYLETGPPEDEAGPLRSIRQQVQAIWDRRN